MEQGSQALPILRGEQALALGFTALVKSRVLPFSTIQASRHRRAVVIARNERSRSPAAPLAKQVAPRHSTASTLSPRLRPPRVDAALLCRCAD